jgi:hypothetical protein
VSARAATLIAFGAAILCVIIYWPGLAGSFILDDTENFAPIKAWLDGRIGFLGVLSSNDSGPLGRPLSMATFAITAKLHGLNPVAFKATNLAIHLACAGLVFVLVNNLVFMDTRLRLHHRLIAGLVATFWMLAPIQVSTVLYPVQRMSQLSGALILLGLIAYVAGRQMLDSPERRIQGLLLVVVGVPMCTILAVLAKENGAVLPLLCIALEYTVFRARRRPCYIPWCIAAILSLPAMLLLFPAVFDRLVMQGYSSRDFSLIDRLLTQPRVLWDYVLAIVLPNGPRMGLIHDDFVVSRNLFTPATTLPAILGWLAAALAAIGYANRAPLVAAGVLLFLGAHTVESTVFPLEIYFEHRNYVASSGIWIACITGIGYLLSIVQPTAAFRKVIPVASLLFVATFAAATHARASAWASWDILLTQAVLLQRDSPRLNGMYGALLLERGDLVGAIEYFERVPRAGVYAPVVPMWIVLATCMSGETVSEQMIGDWEGARPETMGASVQQAVRMLTTEIENERCRGLDAKRARSILEPWIVHLDANQPRTRHWRLRYSAARLAAASGQWPVALAHARDAATDSNDNLDALVLWFQIASSMGARADARAALDDLRLAVPSWHYQLQEAVRRFEASLEAPSAIAPTHTESQSPAARSPKPELSP